MANLTTSLTNAEYRAQKGVSKSELDLANKSVALLEWNRNNPAPGSESVDLGTHVHCALLEPDVFAKDYVRMPEFDLKTKAGKESAEAFKRSVGDGKIILDAEAAGKVIAMRDSVLAHPVANALLTSKGISEASIFGEINGVRVKARPDRIVDHSVFNQHILIDVKKCASIDEFAKSVMGFRYNVQHAFYSDIYEQYSGNKPRFVFIVVGEKREIGRHPVRVWELPGRIVDIGRSDYLADLELVKEYQDFGIGLDIEELFIPEYLMRKG